MHLQQQMKIYLGTLLLIILITNIHSQTYTKIINRGDPEALCLDGQPSFLYYPQNTSFNEGIIIYFMDTPSSPFCGNTSLSTSLDSCINAQNQLTSFWATKLDINSGMLVDNSYKSWAKVIVPYCDGALFQGYAKNPTKYKAKDLYFRGTKIIKSNLLQITKRYNLTTLTKIVFAGSGIGAVGALTWARYFRDEYVYSNKNLKFSVVLDSYPFFYPSFKSKRNEFQIALQNMMKITNAEQSHPFLLCALRNEGQQQRCFDFEQAYPYTNFPIISIGSQYDLFTISRVLEIGCISPKGSLSSCTAAQKEYIQKQRLSQNVALFRFVNFHDNSYWSISCPANNFLNDKYASQNYVIRDPNSNFVDVNKAVNYFVNGDRSTYYDPNTWPGNANCSSL